jgi:hypothetical protein
MSGTPTEDNSYVFHTIRRALTTIADPDLLDFNLLATPGLTNESLTQYSIQLCEDRADALALIDLPSVYTPTHEEYKTKNNRPSKNPLGTANSLKDRRLDSSYGATFYPWVQTRDAATGQLVWIPPTVAMMGVLASSEAVSDIWFAPAGSTAVDSPKVPLVFQFLAYPRGCLLEIATRSTMRALTRLHHSHQTELLFSDKRHFKSAHRHLIELTCVDW